ncbi:MAG TPA: hypothetical protein VF461_22710 [Gemmatimonadaceae bacterium]
MSRPSSACIRFCTIAAAAVILVAAFEWTIIDAVTEFLFMPLQVAAWLPLLVGFGWAVITYARFRASDRTASYPLLICVVGVAIVLFVPWTTVWLAANELVHRSDRERIVQQVQQGALRPNVGYNSALIALSSDSPDVSKGGNEIIVEEHDGRRYVFFYTYRGILDHYSGFLYVPAGADPRAFREAADRSTVMEPRSPNWYFLAHH